jgi:hypothetical protein
MNLSVAMKPFDDEEFSTFAPVRAAAGMMDFCTREGAQALKDKIEAYWRERGHAVMVSLENVGFHPAIRAARYEVRSDMVNGMPRSAISAAKKEPAAANDVYVEDYNGDDVDFE